MPHAVAIPLPEELEKCKDQITNLVCGKRHSLLLTASKKIWAVGNVKEEKASRLQQLKATDGKEETKAGADNDDADGKGGRPRIARMR